MSYKPKFIQGEVIKDIQTLVLQSHVYHHNKVIHKGWFLNFQIQYTLFQLKNGNFKFAIRKER